MAVTTPHGAIGIQDVVYAVLDDSTDVYGGTPSYGAVKSLAGGIKFEHKKNAGLTTDYADDMAYATAAYQGKSQVSAELFDVDPAAYAEILGLSYANGVVEETPIDVSPYVAVGYKIMYYGTASTMFYKYIWLLKGRFSKPDEGGETKKDNINFQHVTMAAEFIELRANRKREVWVRTDDSAASATTLTNWFNQPVISNSVDLGALTLTSATGVISTKTFTLTFAKAGGGSTTIADGSTYNVAIALASTGTLIALTTFTPGASSTTPTLAVVTSATLTAVPYTVFVTSQLHDANGVSCVQKSVTVTPA